MKHYYYKSLVLFGLSLWLLLIGIPSQAMPETSLNQREILVKVADQLNALLPVLDEAEKQQQNTRIQFHISRFQGHDGRYHNGLRDDMVSMRNAIVDFINQTGQADIDEAEGVHSFIEPQPILPLEFDFVEGQ